MTASGDGDGAALSTVIECIRDPERGKRRLPAIVAMLEAADERTRMAAAWACCAVAVAHPETVAYLVRRLSARLEEDEVSLELTHALDYLLDRYPAEVESVLRAMATEAAERRSRSLPGTGRFTRAHYYSHQPERDGVGRVRLPGEAAGDDPRRAYPSGGPDDAERAANRRTTRADRDDVREATDADGDTAPDAAVDGTDEVVGGDAETGGASADTAPDQGALLGRTAELSAIAERSRFDELHVLATRDQGRYSVDYRALVGQGSEERAVALRMLHLPTDEGVRPVFEDAIREHLDDWAAIDDHDHVVSLLDWGLEPRPWLATDVSAATLADGELDPDHALPDAIDLTDALAHAHRTDVVHGGIDPQNVAVHGDAFDAAGEASSLLTNVGLLSVYRFHVDPATVLDPRFAAPEYFDRQLGRIDAATDIYQLGAVVFAMFAGRPPFDGSFEQVRAAVLDESVPVPGDVATNVPAGVDRAVEKAMSVRKLTRYETVEHFQQDLLAVQEGDAV